MSQKVFLTLLSVFSISWLSAQTIFTHDDIKALTANHKIIAVLPIEYDITEKNLPKNMTPEQVKQEEQQGAYDFQNAMSAYFLRTADRKDVNIAFQEPDETNRILKKSGITLEKIKDFSPADLAKRLGVDAVISGKIVADKPMSMETAIAVSIITGYGSSTNKVDVTLNIHNTTDNQLLWKFYQRISGGWGSSPTDLTDYIMKRAAKKFPYRK
jgi:hypothetical protein